MKLLYGRFRSFLFHKLDTNYYNLMASSATGAAGAADPQVLVLIEGVNDERVVVAAATARFAAAAAKSDALQDDDSSDGANKLRKATRAEDERLSVARDRLVAARETLVNYGAASIAAPSAST